MAQVQWPTYIRNGTSRPVEVAGASIQLSRPGQQALKAAFSNAEYVFNISDGEWTGTLTLRRMVRNSDGHIKIRTLIEQMLDDPGNNWTLVPWAKPSLYTIGSTYDATSPISGMNNNRLTTLIRSANGVARLAAVAATVSRITPGEHFGARGRTYKVLTATASQTNPGEWDVTTSPAMTDTTTRTPVYKRNFLPARFQAGQSIPDSETGIWANGPAIGIIEERNVD